MRRVSAIVGVSETPHVHPRMACLAVGYVIRFNGGVDWRCPRPMRAGAS
jgi:hypothetical protein